jgi:hypothetical protein
LLLGVAANAVPTLQLYLEGATYDDTTETWVLAGGPGRLWVIGDVGGVGSILDVHLAAAYDDAYAPTILLTPTAAVTPPVTRFGFADPSMAAAPTSDGVVHTGTPTLNDGSALPTHGVYGEGTVWQEFDLGDMTLTDSQMADFGGGFPTAFANSWGQINVYDLFVAGAGLPEDFTVHFDVYNHVAGESRSRFAPFSHDGEYIPPPPIPEPAGMVILGSIGLGMLLVQRKRKARRDV